MNTHMGNRAYTKEYKKKIRIWATEQFYNTMF